MTEAWVVRAGRHGEREGEAFQEGYAIAGWQELGDLSQVTNREELRILLNQTYPDRRPAVLANWTGQLWRFLRVIQDGDFVVIPKTRLGQIAIGRVTGPYQYRDGAPAGFRHVRPVEWLRTDLPREEVRFDLLNSMGALLTVFGLKRHGAADRIAYLAERGVDPGRTSEDTSRDTFATRDELLDLATESATDEPPRLSIRELLELWGAGRRTARVVTEIASDLTDRGLTTKPPFTEGWVNTMVQIVPVGGEPEPAAEGEDVAEGEDASPDAIPADLPPISLRVGDLEAASKSIVSVSVDAPIHMAYTLMLTGDYSQLLVTDPDGTPRGALSWESIGKAHLAGKDLTIANTTVNALVVEHDEDLLGRISEIYHQGFIFVRGADFRSVTGIVTAADLTREFGNMAKPFAIIEQIERRLRRRVAEVFTLDEIRAAVNRPNKIKSAADLTLGAYGHLLKTEAAFARLGWPLDHDTFLEQLEKVRGTRNELMHFSPDPLTQQQNNIIDGFLNMLRVVDSRP